MYGQFEVDHKSGGRECTAVAVEYDTLCEGEGEVVVDVVVVGRPFGLGWWLNPNIISHPDEIKKVAPEQIPSIYIV